MSAVCRSFFCFTNSVGNFLPSRQFCSISLPNFNRGTSINLSFGLVAPWPVIKTESAFKDFFATIEKAQEGGISYIQLWGPNEEIQASLPLVIHLKKLTEKKNIPVIVNNCVEVAYKAGLKGVHLGQKDSHWRVARDYLGPKAIIGLTVNKWEDVVKAEEFDIDYLGVQLFPSKYTKPPKLTDTPTWGLIGAKKVISFTRHRVVFIGNITLANLPTISDMLRPGDGIAMAGEIMRAKDPALTAREVHQLVVEKLKKNGGGVC